MKTIEGRVSLIASFDIQGSQVPSVEAALNRLRGEIDIADLRISVRQVLPLFHAKPEPVVEVPAEAAPVEPAAVPFDSSTSKPARGRARGLASINRAKE